MEFIEQNTQQVFHILEKENPPGILVDGTCERINATYHVIEMINHYELMLTTN